jgi:hypothetical protein
MALKERGCLRPNAQRGCGGDPAAESAQAPFAAASLLLRSHGHHLSHFCALY